MHGEGGRGFRRSEKAEQPKITKALVSRALGYLKPYRGQLLVVAFIIAVSAVLGLVPPIITGRIIDDGFNGGDFDIIWQLILVSFCVFIMSNLLGVLQSYLSRWISEHIALDMRNQMYRHLEFMSHRFFTVEKQGDIITRLNTDVSGVQGVVSSTLTTIFSNILVLVTTAIALYSTNWILATIGIIIIPLFILPTKIVGKRRFELTLEKQRKLDEINQLLSETLSVSGSLLVKIFTKEDEEYAKYSDINTEIMRINIRESIIGRWFGMALGVFTSMGPKLIYLAAAVIIFKLGDGSLTVGDVIVMVALINRLYGPVNSLFSLQVDITRSMALFKRVFDYFDMPHEVENKPGAVAVETVAGNIEFKDVSFSYTQGLPILKDISFKVDSGRTVAIVGPSGAGKSTIINLIPRLYDAISGSVRIDGLDIKDADMFSLRRHIGYVTQDTYLFNGTVKANLLYANKDATDAQIIDACKRAHIHDYIDSLPEKYETVVGNRGLKLSGGEKQRISIARVILKDPKILILDEATSSLDSISENLIQQAIEPLLDNRTSVVIAHRLSTVMAADEIIVLEKGEIAERGAHQDLLLRGGVYKELYETQFRRAIEDSLHPLA